VRAFLGDEVADVYAMAHLVIGRAGAGTVNELANLGKPSVLIPLPGAKEQEANANALQREGGAIVIPQEELTAGKLTTTVRDLLVDPGRLAAMRDAALKLSTAGAADLLADELERLAKSPAGRR
jgi:UDP-N-acetylglucosamine--N-acetylmuramyl-(pentapeptide) pyrophosphoryl-undecaprenol N-acetylglucosamine transferase